MVAERWWWRKLEEALGVEGFALILLERDMCAVTFERLGVFIFAFWLWALARCGGELDGSIDS